MADYWKEMNTPPPVPGGAPATEVLVPSNAKLVRQMRAGAMWLFAYAAFTVVNHVLGVIGAPIRMIVGLLTSEFVVAVGYHVGGLAVPAGYAGSLVLILVTALFGFFAYRFAAWAFWAGTLVLAADAVINYLVTTLAGLGPFILHLVAIWFLVLGAKAARLHAQRRSEGKA
jgi:hypothetical protein